MNGKFRSWMTAVDDDLLEEAMAPVKKRSRIPWLGAAVAACLLLVAGLSMRTPALTAADLLDMGYAFALPDEAAQVRYEILSQEDQQVAQASFKIQDTEYVYQAIKTQEPLRLADSGDGADQVLSWSVENLDIQMLSSSSSTSVSWYTSEEQTQHYLTGAGNSLDVLTTASHILRATGLDVAAAPEQAENITYNVFSQDELTVVETTFRISGITYSYRMAATLEIQDDFADISGISDLFADNRDCNVRWCDAKLSYNEGGQGKILWFDVVPGILYSLSMDSGACVDALLDMANELFEPLQENS